MRRGKRTPKSDLKYYKEEDRGLHLDRSLPLRVLPAQIGQTEDSQADGKLRLGLVDGLCFLGGIFIIFGDQGLDEGKLRLGVVVGVWVSHTQVAKPT